MSAEAAPVTAARKRRKRLAIASIIALAVVVIAVAAYVLLGSNKSSATTVTTAAATVRTVTSTVSGTGSLKVSNSVAVSPKVSGTVEELYVSLGDTVAVGQKLYKISAADAQAALLKANTALIQAKQGLNSAQAQVRQANNSVYSAQTQQIQAQQNLDKLNGDPKSTADQISLAERALVSANASVTSAQANVANASLGIDVAQANLTAAQDSYDTAAANAQNTVVTAPMAGVVTALPFTVGSTVSAGTSSSSGTSGSTASGANSTSASNSASTSSSTALTISDFGSLRVGMSVSEVDVTKLVLGQTASVKIDALPNETFVGTIASISPNGTSSSGVVSYSVELTLDKQDSRLRPSMTATADIRVSTAENALTIPSVALKTGTNGKYVQILKNGASTDASVTVGISDGTYTEIKSGMAKGDVVITGSVSTGTASTSSSSAGLLGGVGGAGAGRIPGGN